MTETYLAPADWPTAEEIESWSYDSQQLWSPVDALPIDYGGVDDDGTDLQHAQDVFRRCVLDAIRSHEAARQE